VSSEFEIIVSDRAKKTLKGLSKQDQLRIKHAISKLSKYPPDLKIVKLKGGQGELRLRVGNWRVLFEYAFKENHVRILDIGHRREIYR